MEQGFEPVHREARAELGWHLHMEWMRATIRKALADGKRTSEVAAEIGVDVGRVRTFLLGRHLFKSAVEPFAAWCDDREFQRFHMEQAALAVLVADHPQLARPWVRCYMARTMKHTYISRGDRVPDWVSDELAAWDQLKPRQNKQWP
jgi:hypothetical protein